MDRDEGQHQHESGAFIIPASAPSLPTSPAPQDMEEYLRELEGSDLTEAQKRELLQTLWEIICDFARLGYGLDPVLGIITPALGEEFAAQADTPTKAEE